MKIMNHGIFLGFVLQLLSTGCETMQNLATYAKMLSFNEFQTLFESVIDIFL